MSNYLPIEGNCCVRSPDCGHDGGCEVEEGRPVPLRGGGGPLGPPSIQQCIIKGFKKKRSVLFVLFLVNTFVEITF